MTSVALALAAVTLVCVLGFAGVLRSLVRQHARERDLLINQIMHLSGKTWSPPPSRDETPAETGTFEERFTYTPAFDDIDE